jgi:3-mercaptopyruvate sulfurtransferase SseA
MKGKMMIRPLVILTLLLLAAFRLNPSPAGPQTGRTAGAGEISPDDVRKQLDAKAPVLIIEVRDPEEFSKETIKGAVNIPLSRLEVRLKDIPKDTVLVFT